MRDNSQKPGAKTSTTDDVCAGHALGFPMRSELAFSPIENITLDVFRAICDVYTTGSAQPWDVAVKISEDALGVDDGPLLVARVTALLRALRAERKIGFSYLSVGCQHVSPDELAVSGLLKAARGRDENGIQRGLLLALDKPQSATRTPAAARALAAFQARLSSPRPSGHADVQDLHAQVVDAFYLH
jgi:hypothetical protein